jgi:Domain of unknown function (DUF4505)
MLICRLLVAILKRFDRRNFVTALKDPAFLNFFYARIKPNDTKLNDEIPFVSLCGREINFLTPDDSASALTFSSLAVDEQVPGQHKLFLGQSSWTQPFNPELLKISASSGRVYHPITSHKYLTPANAMGLLSSLISTGHFANDLMIEGESFYLRWQGVKYPISVTE